MMWAVLAQKDDYDEALEGFGKKSKDAWTPKKKRKDHKAMSLIQLHLHNDISQEVLQNSG